MREEMRVLKRAAAWLRRSPDGGLSQSSRRARMGNRRPRKIH